MILEMAKSLTYNLGVAYAKAAVKKRVKFKDLPETHQKAIMAYMQDGAWGLDSSEPDDVIQAVKLYGNKPFFMGELAIDDGLKKAIMSSKDFEHDTFEAWVKWYGRHDSESFKAKYNEDWPVILNQPSLVPDWGLFEDGWHRFNYHYIAKKKSKVPFIQYVPGTKYWSEARIQKLPLLEVSNVRTADEMDALGRDIQLDLKKKHPHVSVSVIDAFFDHNKSVENGWVPETLHIGLVETDYGHENKGYYKAFKKDLISLADDHRVALATYPTSDFGSDRSRLIKTNKALGFNGPDENGLMVRPPLIKDTVKESAFFSKQDPVNTGGRVVPRKLSGFVYHGSSTDGVDGWFDNLEVDDEAAAVWVTPEEAMARRFGQGRSHNRFVFVNKYRLKSVKAAELDQKAYDRISSQEDFDSDGRDMRYALADYLSGKGYSAWLTTGSISGKTYEDVAIFSGSESEAEYVGTSFMLKDGSWSEYEYLQDEEEAREHLGKINPLSK